MISLQDGFVATKKEFVVDKKELKDENIFEVNKQSAPKREEDVRIIFWDLFSSYNYTTLILVVFSV